MSRKQSRPDPDRYSGPIEKTKKNQTMTTPKRCNVIPLFPEKEDAATTAGWDPYIFSIVSGQKWPLGEERRRMPRPLTATRRRALLLATRFKTRPRNR
jgi:hypothetical protein